MTEYYFWLGREADTPRFRIDYAMERMAERIYVPAFYDLDVRGAFFHAYHPDESQQEETK